MSGVRKYASAGARTPSTPIDKNAPPPMKRPFTTSARSASSRPYVLELRARGVSWQNISRMTGIPVPTLQQHYAPAPVVMVPA